MKPVINQAGRASATEVPLHWDMPSLFWDSGLFWDGSVMQNQPLVPVIGTVREALEIGTV